MSLVSKNYVVAVAAMLLAGTAAAQAKVDLPPNPNPPAATCDAACRAAIQQENDLKNRGLVRGGPATTATPPADTQSPAAQGDSPQATPTPTSGGVDPATPSTSSPSTGGAGLACPEPPTGSSATASRTYLNCDMSYRDTVVACDLHSTTPSCPKQPMPMKDTARKSLIKDYTPYLFAFAHDPDDTSKAYSGQFYRGTPGDPGQTFQIFGSGSGKNLAPCISEIKLSGSSNLSVADQAKLVRLQLDNCTNQYILHAALGALQKEQKAATRLFSLEDPTDPTKKVGLDTHCQPLRTTPDSTQEYLASEYLEVAWKKMLVDPTFRKDPDAPLEPHLPDGVTLQNTDNANVKLPKPFPEVRLSQIAAIPYEEINDPTHPYSPRWDFKWNERDHYSPLTQSYSGDSKNAVFCAGDKSKQTTKVDILSFRENALNFDKKVTDRIDFNKACKANSGLQKNPCCKVNTHGSPFVVDWTCDVQPCATCYGMTPANPVCKTDYVSTPDRNKVKVPYLPVNPVLRVASQASNIASNLQSLSSLPANLPVSQVQAILGSQLGILNSLPGGLSIAQALPLLNGQVNMLGALNGIAGQVGLGQLSSLTALQGNLLGNLPGNLNLSQVQGIMSGQVNILNSLGGIAGVGGSGGGGLSLGQSLSGLGAVSNLLGGLPGGTQFGQVTSLLSGQAALAGSLPSGISAASATNLLNQQLGSLAGVNQALSIGQAISSGAINVTIPGLNQLPSNLPVSQVRSLLSSNITGLSQLGSGATASQFAQVLNSQLGGVLKLPADLPIGQVSSMLGGLQTGLGALGASGNINLSQVSSVFGSQLGSLAGLPSNLNPAQLGAMLGSTSGLLNSISGAGLSSLGNVAGLGNISSLANIGQLQSVLTGQLGSLTGLGAGTVGQLTSALTGQLGALGSFAGNLPIGSLTGALGGIPGIPSIPGVPKVVPGQTSLPFLVVAATPYQRTAKCNPNEFGADNSDSMANLCRKLRAPVTMMNKLKMRYHNPDDKDNITLKEGVQEGLWFKDYFADHMPYPRLWDTGRSIQKSTSTDQDPLDANGQFTAIVGVGREAAAGNADTKPKHEDQRCLLGGWGENTSVGAASIKIPDPVTSWTELKLYQSRTLRYFGLSCLARYDKTFKSGGTEDLALGAAGAEWSRTLATTCDKDGKNCTTTNRFGANGDTAAGNASARNQLLNENWPLSWHGYMGAKKDSDRFPDFGGTAGHLLTGLDNAQEGDLVLLPNGAAKDGDLPGLAKLGIVSRVSLDSNCAANKNCYVEVTEGDNGKWPDVCGTTASFGELKTRSLYRPGGLATNVSDELVKHVKWTASCDDPGISSCEMANWDKVKLYRIREDVRTGCDKSKSSDCTDSEATP